MLENFISWLHAWGPISAAVAAAVIALYGNMRVSQRNIDVQQARAASALLAEVLSIGLRLPSIYVSISTNSRINPRTTHLLEHHTQIFDTNPTVVGEFPAEASTKIITFYYQLKSEIEVAKAVTEEGPRILSEDELAIYLGNWKQIMELCDDAADELSKLCKAETVKSIHRAAAKRAMSNLMIGSENSPRSSTSTDD